MSEEKKIITESGYINNGVRIVTERNVSGQCFGVPQLMPEARKILLDLLLTKAKEKAFEAPTRQKLSNPPIYIHESCVEVVAFEDLEQIVKELIGEDKEQK